MKYFFLIIPATFAFLSMLSMPLAAQSETDCGDPPTEPTLVDGATSTMEQLVINSKEVNAYISEADEFLDCSEDRYIRISHSKAHSKQLAEQVKAITERRNTIGDKFNTQVTAFKAANP